MARARSGRRQRGRCVLRAWLLVAACGLAGCDELDKAYTAWACRDAGACEMLGGVELTGPATAPVGQCVPIHVQVTGEHPNEVEPSVVLGSSAGEIHATPGCAQVVTRVPLQQGAADFGFRALKYGELRLEARAGVLFGATAVTAVGDLEVEPGIVVADAGTCVTVEFRVRGQPAAMDLTPALTHQLAVEVRSGGARLGELSSSCGASSLDFTLPEGFVAGGQFFVTPGPAVGLMAEVEVRGAADAGSWLNPALLKVWGECIGMNGAGCDAGAPCCASLSCMANTCR